MKNLHPLTGNSISNFTTFKQQTSEVSQWFYYHIRNLSQEMRNDRGSAASVIFIANTLFFAIITQPFASYCHHRIMNQPEETTSRQLWIAKATVITLPSLAFNYVFFRHVINYQISLPIMAACTIMQIFCHAILQKPKKESIPLEQTKKDSAVKQNKPTDQPVEKPEDKPVGKLADKSEEEPAEKLVEKPVEKPTDKSEDKPANKSEDKPEDKPTDKSEEKPAITQKTSSTDTRPASPLSDIEDGILVKPPSPEPSKPNWFSWLWKN